MKTTEILELDCRISKNKEIIQNELRKIKPLAKCSDEYDIPMNKLEKCLQVLCRNYEMYPRQIVPDVFATEKGIVWRFELIDLKNLKVLGKCYGLNLYELMCKAVIMMYVISRKRSKEK